MTTNKTLQAEMQKLLTTVEDTRKSILLSHMPMLNETGRIRAEYEWMRDCYAVHTGELLSYIRTLEREHRAMRGFLEAVGKCETEIECVNECHSQANAILMTLFHPENDYN